jgi:hypothetical protein
MKTNFNFYKELTPSEVRDNKKALIKEEIQFLTGLSEVATGARKEYLMKSINSCKSALSRISKK